MVFASAVGRQDRPDEVHEDVLYSFVPHFGARYIRRLEKLWPRHPKRKPPIASPIHMLGYWVGVALRARRACADLIWIYNYSQAVPIVRRLNPRATIVLNMQTDWLAVLDRRMVERRLACLDLVVGCSDCVRDKVCARFPLFADRCVTVHNGVKAEPLGSLPLAREANDGEVRILFVGRISPEKGVHVLFEAFVRVWRRNPRVRLTVVGGNSVAHHERELTDDEWPRGLDRFYSGDYAQTLLDSLDREVAARIAMTGFLLHDEIVGHYRTADVFVCPSVWEEPFGIPAIEAMAAGLPVVATSAGGFLDSVEPGRTGLLVPRGDSQALADAILILVEDRELRERFGAAGRARALELYSFDAMASTLENRLGLAPPAGATDAPGGHERAEKSGAGRI